MATVNSLTTERTERTSSVRRLVSDLASGVTTSTRVNVRKYAFIITVILLISMPPPRRGGGGGIKRSSASVVRPSVRPSVCLMSRTSALTRKPKVLGRRNFAQGYPRSHATPTPTSRSKGQKSRSAGAGAYCGGHLAAQLVKHTYTYPT